MTDFYATLPLTLSPRFTHILNGWMERGITFSYHKDSIFHVITAHDHGHQVGIGRGILLAKAVVGVDVELEQLYGKEK